jgi:hypothetical protein
MEDASNVSIRRAGRMNFFMGLLSVKVLGTKNPP